MRMLKPETFEETALRLGAEPIGHAGVNSKEAGRQYIVDFTTGRQYIVDCTSAVLQIAEDMREHGATADQVYPTIEQALISDSGLPPETARVITEGVRKCVESEIKRREGGEA